MSQAAVNRFMSQETPSLRLGEFRRSSVWRSVWQLVSTLTLFCASWYAAWYAYSTSYWLTLAAAIPAGGLLLRLFVLAHDCGHGSFFPSKTWNSIVGSVLGVLTFTPFHRWRKHHAVHHATSGDLDRRGGGDVRLLTVREYEALSPASRWWYRFERHPLILFGIAPVLYFVLWQRVVQEPPEWKSERRSVHLTNLAIIAFVAGLGWLIGPWKFLAIHVPIVALASSAGVWLFFVQHHYEGAYWRNHDEWDHGAAGLYGSSYYKLPRWLQWLTANIGLHHVHHLDSRIPNYRLQECLDQNPSLSEMKPLTLTSSLGCARLRLWDEEHECMVPIEQDRSPKHGRT